MDRVDAVVVGAGVIGLAVGRALAARGLETLVVELRPLLFMRDARMSERLGEELRILKLITNAFFERVHEGDRQGARLVCFS